MIAGLCQELVERLDARGACFYPPRAEWGNPSDELVAQYQRWGLVWGSAPHKVRYSVAYDPEEFKFVAILGWPKPAFGFSTIDGPRT